MTLIRLHDVECDICYEAPLEPAPDPDLLRVQLEAIGWATDLPGGRDCCQSCWTANQFTNRTQAADWIAARKYTIS